MGNLCFKTVCSVSPELNNQINRLRNTTLTSVDLMIIHNYNKKIPLKHIDPRTGRSLSIG